MFAKVMLSRGNDGAFTSVFLCMAPPLLCHRRRASHGLCRASLSLFGDADFDDQVARMLLSLSAARLSTSADMPFGGGYPR
jgi:hypothetical protein